jgi:flagellar biosynthesis chaperone FliJ
MGSLGWRLGPMTAAPCQRFVERRHCNSTLSDLDSRLDNIQRKFSEAREEIELAREVWGVNVKLD